MSRAEPIAAACFLMLTFSQATVDARTPQETTEPDPASSDVDTNGDDRPLGELRKGDRQWGLLAGAGTAHKIYGGVADRQFLVLGGRYGRFVTDPVGPAFIKGNMELGVEVDPVFLMFQNPTTYGFGFTLLFRHYMAPSSKVKPFFTFGTGALFSIDRIPAESSRVNFATQAGLGIMGFLRPGLALSFEYRVHHISNAETAKVNPGINSSYIQLGVSIFR